jgi:hypothetical protein
MKAYVIKNKEGEYKREDIIEYIWKETTSYFSKDIRCADIFTEEEMAKCYCPKDCKVVEITIAEGDLEKEIRKQVCDEIRELAHDYMEMPICENCGEEFVRDDNRPCKYCCDRCRRQAEYKAYKERKQNG